MSRFAFNVVRDYTSLCAFFAVVLGFVPSLLSAGAGEARLFVETDASQYEVGDSLTAEVRLDVNLTSPSRVGVFLSFDPTRLQFNSGLTNRTVFNNVIFTGDPMEMESGVVSFSASSVNPVVQNNVLVATLEFTVLASGDTSFTYLQTPPRETAVADSNGVLLPLMVEGTTVTVQRLPLAHVYLEPAFTQIATSETVNVDVLLDAPDVGVRQTEVYLTYDDSVVAFRGGTVNTALFDSTLITTNVTEPTTGLLVFSTGSFAPAVGEGLLLATLEFEGIADGPSPLDFLGVAPQRTQARDINFSNILTQTTGGMIHVGSDAFARLSLTPETQTGPVGEPVVVDVIIDANMVDAGVVEVFLDYDETRLSFVDGSINTAVFNNDPLNKTPESNGSRIALTAATGSGVSGAQIRVATLNFRSTNPGQANFAFLTTVGQETSVVTPQLDPIAVILDTAWSRASRVGVAELRFEPKLGAVERMTSRTLEVRLDANGEPVRSVRGFVGFDSLVSFTGGSINDAVFNNVGFNDQPMLSMTESGVVTFNASAMSDVTGNDVLVATLIIETGNEEGVATFEFLTRNTNETAALTSSFSSIPVNVDSGTLFIREDTLAVASITRSDDSPTSAMQVGWDVVFTDTVSGVDLTDFELETGGNITGSQLVSVNGSNNVWHVEALAGEGEGTVRLNLRDDDSIVDGSLRVLGGVGVGNGDFIGQAYQVDTESPGVLLATFLPDLTNSPLIPVDVTFTEPVFGFTAGDVAVSAGSVTNFSGSGASYMFDVNAPEGNLEVTIPAAVAVDVAGNGNLASSNTLTFTVDLTPPQLTIVKAHNDPTNNQTVEFTLNFSESVGSSFTEADIMTSGSLSGLSTFELSGMGQQRTVEVELASDDLIGTIGIVVGTSIFDEAGNQISGISSSFYEIDTVAPMGSFTRLDPEVTFSEQVRFDLTLDEEVGALDAGDLQIVSNEITTASIDSVSGSGLSFEVTVNTGTQEGNLGLEFNPASSVSDAAGNLAQSTTEFYTVDRQRPGVMLSSLETSPTNADRIGFDVDFTEDVVGFVAGDVLVSDGQVENFTGSGASYSFEVANAGEGMLSATIPSGVAADAGGNLNTASGEVVVSIDRTPPTLSFVYNGDSPTNADEIEFQVNYSEAIAVSSSSGYATSGTLSGVAQLAFSNDVLTVTLTDPDADGTLSVAYMSGTFDAAGNEAPATETQLVVIDNTPPSVISATRVDPSPTNLGTVLYNVEFSEPLVAFDTGDTSLAVVGLSDTSVADVTPFGEKAYIVSAFTGTGIGTLQLIIIDDDTVTDLAGNPLGGPGLANGDFQGESYVINRGTLGPTGLTTQQIVDYLNGENPNGFEDDLFDVNGDGIIDSADVIFNVLNEN